MRQLYSFLTYASQPILGVAGLFNPKLKEFVKGRKHLFKNLKKQLKTSDKYIWVHCASLGEYEQGLPVINGLTKQYPEYKILLSFFSPSGYLVRKDNANAHIVTYLPLDTQANAKKFVALVNPKMAIFVKYEFWPNYFTELQNQNILTLIVSGLFRPNQALFKNYGSWIKEALNAVDHFFVQNEQSVKLLNQHGFTNTTLSGDTRFDRVSKQIKQDNALEFMDQFAQDALCVVCGSTWPEDQALMANYIKVHASEKTKFVIAPHNIGQKEISSLENEFKTLAVTYSKSTPESLKDATVLIVDTVGHLSRIYSYAHIAYVGGAMGNTGLHNILEPATFGIPIVIGKNYSKFPEARKLRELAGLYSVSDLDEFAIILNKLSSDSKFREQTGMICGHFINSNTGATRTILETINSLYRDRLV